MIHLRPLGDLYETPSRNGLSVPSRLRRGSTPMVGMKEIFAEDRIGTVAAECVDLPGDDWLLRAGDLLFARQSLTFQGAGKCSLVLASDQERTWESHLIRVRLNTTLVVPAFVYYWFRSGQGRFSIEAHIQQVAAAGIRGSDLAKVSVPLPPLATQRAVARVLGALDDKIAANTELANAIDGLCEALLDRFRGHGDTTLARIATVNGETVKPGRGDLRYLDISSVSTGGYSWPAPIPWAEAPGRARRLVKAGDTVWSTVRPNRRSHALVLDEGLIGSTGLAVITPTTAGPAFVYEATKTAEFTAYLEAVAEGSAYPAVRAERFLQAPVPNVGTEARERFESVAFPARLRAHAAAVESRRLASLRDSLLPHLMSGRITVREAEKTVEEVL